jgi:hypothetical protein
VGIVGSAEGIGSAQTVMVSLRFLWVLLAVNVCCAMALFSQLKDVYPEEENLSCLVCAYAMTAVELEIRELAFNWRGMSVNQRKRALAKIISSKSCSYALTNKLAWINLHGQKFRLVNYMELMSLQVDTSNGEALDFELDPKMYSTIHSACMELAGDDNTLSTMMMLYFENPDHPETVSLKPQICSKHLSVCPDIKEEDEELSQERADLRKQLDADAIRREEAGLGQKSFNGG